MPPVDLKARIAELEKQWRGEAHLGSRLERGKGRDEAMIHCADGLAALLVGEEPPADRDWRSTMGRLHAAWTDRIRTLEDALRPFAELVHEDGVEAPYPEEWWIPRLDAARAALYGRADGDR